MNSRYYFYCMLCYLCYYFSPYHNKTLFSYVIFIIIIFIIIGSFKDQSSGLFRLEEKQSIRAQNGL
jgi:hypothetical protein